MKKLLLLTVLFCFYACSPDFNGLATADGNFSPDSNLPPEEELARAVIDPVVTCLFHEFNEETEECEKRCLTMDQGLSLGEGCGKCPNGQVQGYDIDNEEFICVAYLGDIWIVGEVFDDGSEVFRSYIKPRHHIDDNFVTLNFSDFASNAEDLSVLEDSVRLWFHQDGFHLREIISEQLMPEQGYVSAYVNQDISIMLVEDTRSGQYHKYKFQRVRHASN